MMSIRFIQALVFFHKCFRVSLKLALASVKVKSFNKNRNPTVSNTSLAMEITTFSIGLRGKQRDKALK